MKKIKKFLRNVFFDQWGFRDYWVVITILVVIAAIFAGVIYAYVSADRHACDTYAQLNSDYQVQYVPNLGCMIRIDGLWLDKDSVYLPD